MKIPYLLDYLSGLAILLGSLATTLLILVPVKPPGRALQFPNGDARALGQIEKLVVTVFCGHITSLRDIPQAHDVRMSYETQTGDVMEAQARLGISAVPTFIFDRKVGVSGAQPPESLAAAMREAAGVSG